MDTTIRRLLGKEFKVGRRKAFVVGADREIGISGKYKTTQEECLCLNKKIVLEAEWIKYPNRAYHLAFTYLVNLIDNGKVKECLEMGLNEDGEVTIIEAYKDTQLMACPFE